MSENPIPGLRRRVACPRCARQADASDRAPGERFLCRCGQPLVVPAATAHEAAVVRCSSCGAPRSGLAAACSFCGADFTLREQDLDTLCPGCLARISGKGRFCHHCGLPVTAEEHAGDISGLACPACGEASELHSRRLGRGGHSALECRRCAGLWLGNETFRQLAERAREDEVPGLPAPAAATLPGAALPQAGPVYRCCPRCGTRMNRQNFGRGSGVILDLCSRHGVWLDAHELDRIVAWIRRGGQAAAERSLAEEQLALARAERVRARVARSETLAGLGEDDHPWDEVLGGLASFLTRVGLWLGRDAR